MPETQTAAKLHETRTSGASGRTCRVAVIWIDWYAYHVARFSGISSAPELAGRVAGIELVGGIGVHAGLKFREHLPDDLPVFTIMPDANWRETGQFRLAWRLWRHLSKLRPEVLLVPGYYTLPALAAALWCRFHRRTSVLMTESTSEDHDRTWWKERAKSILICSLFDWAVTGGDAHVRYLRLLGFPESRVAHFYDVVDNDFYGRTSLALRKQSPAAFSLPAEYFLYVGRLAPEKNVEGLLSSWIEYRRTGGKWPLVLVGHGPSSEVLRRLADASAYGADVIFAGHRSSSELPPYYAFAGCFVLPSTREPWGLVVNEAMASGVPVLVSARCGCAESLVVSGYNGFTFDPSNSAQLTFLMKQMESLTPAQRREMRTASTALIRAYSPLALGREISKIWTQQHLRG